MQAREGIASKKNKHDVFFIPRFFYQEPWSERIARIVGTLSPRKTFHGAGTIGLQASEGIACKKNKHDVFFIPRYFFTKKLGAK